jgi:hypothetical protein
MQGIQFESTGLLGQHPPSPFLMIGQRAQRREQGVNAATDVEDRISDKKLILEDAPHQILPFGTFKYSS